ncbi:hypothetical protein [Microbulbifer sp. A4B17]|uniref:hypothetical protein n=1 Tax=Microbulbifer sp. A4B17 TaxID=359370 RepID=UPI00130050E9|nr:hypothetical protein [Microbulbifer sp. A4B17]
MKIYIHIGSDKTGSTAIQAALSENQAVLRSQGIEYPVLLKQENHHECLFREIRSGKKGKCWAELERVISSQPEHLIISAEALCSLKASEVALFKKWLNHSDTYVIAYIRRADEYLESGTMQRLKSAKSYAAFRWQYLAAKYIPTIFDPYVYHAAFKTLFIKRWKKEYPNNIIVRPYDKSQWDSQNLILDFFSSLGLTKTQNSIRASKITRNVTPSIAGIYATSILTRNKFFGLRYQLSQRLAEAPQHQKKGAFLSWNKRASARLISRVYNCFTISSRQITFSSERTPRSLGLPRLSDVITTSEDIVANQLAEINKRCINLRQKLNNSSPAHN